MEKTGRAYGLFNCNASKEEIEKDINDIREYVQTSPEMRLKLTTMAEFRANPQSPKKLVNLLDNAEVYPIFPSSSKQEMDKSRPTLAKDLQYVLEASQSGVESEIVARSTGDIVNGVHSLYGKGQPFLGTIVGERVNGRKRDYFELTE